MRESLQKGIHPGFVTQGQGRRHQKSKTGVSMAPRKGLMSSKIKKKGPLWLYNLTFQIDLATCTHSGAFIGIFSSNTHSTDQSKT